MIRRTRSLSLGVATVAALALAAPAGTAAAATYRVAGKLVAVNVDASGAGEYKIRGGLRGKFTINEFTEVSTSPYYEVTGTDLFKGCIDRRRDRSCKGDPSGTLLFKARYWTLFGSADPSSLIWGSCFHPVVEGTGDFAGAQGVLMFVDSPTKQGVKTNYIGTITTKGGKASRHQAKSRTASRRAATSRAGC